MISENSDHSDHNASASENMTVNSLNPWPYLAELFIFKRIEGQSVIMACQACRPKVTE